MDERNLSKHEGSDHGHGGHDHSHELILDIATPKGPFKAEFPTTMSVAYVIDVVVDDKKLDRKDSFELVHGDKVLQPTNRTLGSFGLHGKVELELVATGTGV
jgi:hypothetical protein